MTKVDTSININTTILPGTGTIVCANIALLCRIFAQVQSITEATHDNHPTPFLYSAAVQLGTKITLKAIHNATYGNSEQTILLSYSVLACLDTIIMCLGKEAHNPDLLRLARQDSWERAHSERFAAAHHALILCLRQIDATATGGALLPQTLLYQASDHKQKRDDETIFVAAKRLKLTPHDMPHTGRPQSILQEIHHKTHHHTDHRHHAMTANITGGRITPIALGISFMQQRGTCPCPRATGNDSSGIPPARTVVPAHPVPDSTRPGQRPT